MTGILPASGIRRRYGVAFFSLLLTLRFYSQKPFFVKVLALTYDPSFWHPKTRRKKSGHRQPV
jgi:hypothetical protein